MEKTFVNVLAHSKVLKLLIILILAFVVVADVLVITFIVSLIDYASPEQRAKITRLMALLIISSVAGFPLLYFVRRSLRDQWVKTNDTGITYNSWTKKMSARWSEVTKISVVPRGRYRVLRIDTKKGRFHISPLFVDKSMPIPKLKPGISSQKLSYPGGRIKEVNNIQDSDIYIELQNYIPDLLNASLES